MWFLLKSFIKLKATKALISGVACLKRALYQKCREALLTDCDEYLVTNVGAPVAVSVAPLALINL